jgi:DNA polymerase I-like protein with 3'-5' exonuclease and polymerase domains
VETPNWKPSNNYPDLSKASRISVDLETCDPSLLTMGPGALRKDGFICGFSVAVEGFSDYYPVKHPSGNVENPEAAKRWLKDVMSLPVPKVGANLLYEKIWMKCDWGIEIAGPCYDIQLIDALIDENHKSYKLDDVAFRWLGENKVEHILYQAGIEVLKLRPPKSTPEKEVDPIKAVISEVKGNIWRLPSCYIGDYATADATLPLRILDKQLPVLKEQGLERVFEIETEVLHILYLMWMKGVRIDKEKAIAARDMLSDEYAQTKIKLFSMTGGEIDIWSNKNIAEACDKLGLPYPKTKKEAPSFEAEWLDEQKNSFFTTLLDARQLDRSGSVFIEDKILKMAVGDRIHPQFSQVKGERGGTVSGRFSSSNPNCQQFPSRQKRLAKLVRSIIIPEDGHFFAALDESAQEPRVTLHYANISGCHGASKFVEQFVREPRTDIHNMVALIANIERDSAKTIGLGMTYGMGQKKLIEKLGLSSAEGYVITGKYHEAMPYINPLKTIVSNTAEHRGYIRTILGRRCRFELFGPKQWSDGLIPKRWDEAVKEFGMPITRYFLHKALNRLIQGSSADMIKVTLVLLYRAGILPHMTVHDENDFSFKTLEECIVARDIMTIDTAKYLGMTVPLVCDMKIGRSWGDTKKFYDKDEPYANIKSNWSEMKEWVGL